MHCSLVTEGKILLSRLNSAGLSSGQTGHEFLQHVTSELADHFVEDVGHLEFGWCQTVLGKVVRVSAVETFAAGEVVGMGMVHVHGDWGWEHWHGGSWLWHGDHARCDRVQTSATSRQPEPPVL